MLGQEINGKPIRICDGCGCSEFTVKKLIGMQKNNAFICDECVYKCVEIIQNEDNKK